MKKSENLEIKYDANTDIVKIFDSLFNKLLEDFQKLLIDIMVLEEVIKFLKVIQLYDKFNEFMKYNHNNPISFIIDWSSHIYSL